MTQKGINWNNLLTYQKRGSCCVKNKIIIDNSDNVTVTAQLRNTSKPENEWIIDKEIPIFKGDGRDYIDRLIYVVED